MELFDLEIPIRNTGTSAVLAEWRQMEQTATTSNARVASSFERASRAVERQLVTFRRGASGIDAIAQRTTALTQGLQHAGTQAQSLVRLRAAETQLQTAITRGNTSLFERIRLENELVRVRTALTTATQRQTAAQAQGTATQTGAAGGRLGAAASGAAASAGVALRGFAAGFAGVLAIGAVQRSIQSVTGFLTGAGEAADNLETALRKLNATSRLTGVGIEALREQALGARDAFALSEGQAVELTRITVLLTQRMGDASKAGELMTAWLDLAAANGQNANDALIGLNQTLLGQDEGLNKIGLANPQQIYREWAEAAGLSAAKMTEAQKAQAIFNELTNKGERVVGEYAKSLDSVAGSAVVAAQEQRALQAELGGLFEIVRRANNAENAAEARAVRSVVVFLREQAQFWGRELKATIAEVVRLAQGMPDFSRVMAGSSTTAPEVTPLPDITVDSEALLATNLEAARLGTANAEIRRQLAASARAHAAAARDESLALEDRNTHAARAKEITEALATDTTTATNAVRSRTAALIALLELEGPQVDRWAVLLSRANDLKSALDRGNLSYADRVRVLTELRAIEAATFPSTLPPDRMEPRHAFDIRRPDAGTMPLDLNDPTLNPITIPGGEGSIFGNLAKQIEEDGETAIAAVKTVEERLSAAAEGLAATFTGAVIGAFASLGSGSGIGDMIAEFTGTMLSAIGSMAVEFGLAAIGIGALMEKIMTALASLNPIVVIAAGAALVALGSALRGAASSSFGGASGGSSQTFAPIERTITIAPGTSLPVASGGAAAVQPQSAQTFHFTVIGQHDPVAQRQIAGMVRAATARGA